MLSAIQVEQQAIRLFAPCASYTQGKLHRFRGSGQSPLPRGGLVPRPQRIFFDGGLLIVGEMHEDAASCDIDLPSTSDPS